MIRTRNEWGFLFFVVCNARTRLRDLKVLRRDSEQKEKKKRLKGFPDDRLVSRIYSSQSYVRKTTFTVNSDCVRFGMTPPAPVFYIFFKKETGHGPISTDGSVYE